MSGTVCLPLGGIFIRVIRAVCVVVMAREELIKLTVLRAEIEFFSVYQTGVEPYVAMNIFDIGVN